MKICLVAPIPPPYGGIGNWTLLIKKYIAEREDVDLYVLDIAPRWRSIEDKVKWKRIVGGGIQLIRDYVRFVIKLIFHKPDIVHITAPGQFALIRDVVFLFTSRLLAFKSVYHIRFGRVPEISANNTVEWKIMCLAIKMSDIIIVLDESTFISIVAKFSEKKVKKIVNGIDFRDLSNDSVFLFDKKIVYLGWVIKEKGVEELCAAFDKYNVPEWTCYIIGPGSIKYKAELIGSVGIKNIKVLDELKHVDAIRFMSTCDIFVLPSYTEGFPNVIVEAMAMGKAIVATNVGAISDMLSNGCGIVVPPKDIDALGTAIKYLCQNEDLRKEMGLKAKAKASREYSIDTVMEQLYILWNNTAFCKED